VNGPKDLDVGEPLAGISHNDAVPELFQRTYVLPAAGDATENTVPSPFAPPYVVVP